MEQAMPKHVKPERDKNKTPRRITTPNPRIRTKKKPKTKS